MGSAQIVIGGIVGLGIATGCASTDMTAPQATLAHSIEAEVELRPILSAWTLGDRADRVALEPKIAAFGARRGSDGTSRLADVLLAWVALEKGELSLAEREGQRVVAGAPPGSVSDLGRLTIGASLRRQGKADEAFHQLSPLVSKLIDPWARALLNEEVVRSAVDSGRSKDALTLMRVWLREAPAADLTAVETVIRSALAKTRREDMLEVLARPSSLATEDVALRKLVAARLAQIAGDGAGDAALAKELLARAPALLGDDGDRVAHLAAGVRKARVEARTVGLLLDLRDDAARQRGAEILRGGDLRLGLAGIERAAREPRRERVAAGRTSRSA